MKLVCIKCPCECGECLAPQVGVTYEPSGVGCLDGDTFYEIEELGRNFWHEGFFTEITKTTIEDLFKELDTWL